jgi:hypothetical protein
MKQVTQLEKSALKRSRKGRKEATKNSIPPSSVADLDTCSGMSKKSGSRSGDPDPGIRIRNENPRSYFQELRNQFFWVKIRKFFDADPGWKKFGSRIRDWDPGSGKTSRIRNTASKSKLANLIITVLLYRNSTASGSRSLLRSIDQ